LRAEHDQHELRRGHRHAGADGEQDDATEREKAEIGTAQACHLVLNTAEAGEQHARQRLRRVVADRLDGQVIAPAVLADHRRTSEAADHEGVQVAAHVVQQMGA
jgi:hypothetical protein